MKKYVLKALSFAVAAAMTAGVLAGCGKPADKGGAKQSDPAKIETVKYKIMLNQGITEYPADGGPAKTAILNALEKAGISGIDFDVTLVSGEEYFSKLNLLITAGDTPDYFDVDLARMAQFQKSGTIRALDDLLAKMPNAKKYIRPIDVETFSLDGKLYAFAQGFRPESLNGPSVNGLIMRDDWLKNLGLQKPKTLDELYNVLKAFTFNDPDKNGKNDTFGLGGFQSNYMASVFGAHGISFGIGNIAAPFTAWQEVNGSLVNATVLPETKEVLATLRKWYSEKIIDPEFFILKANQAKEKFANSKIGAYENTVWWANDARISWKNQPEAACSLLSPVTGPKGKKGFPGVGPSGKAMAMSSKIKNPENFAKLLDWSMNYEDNGGAMLVTFGKEGEHFTYDKQKNVIQQKVLASDLYKLGFSNPVRFISVTDRRWVEDPLQRADIETSNKDNIYSSFYGVVPAMTDYPDLKDKLWAEYFVKIVTGEKSLDAFDEYVEKFNKQGGAELTKQVNEAWKKTKK